MNNPLFMKSTVHTSSNKLAYCGDFSRRDMTNEEKLRLVQSVYSNPKRLRIAQFILANPYCTNEEISDVLDIEKTSVSKMVGEMLAVGVVEIITKDKDRRSNHLRLTELGKKLLKI